MVFLHTGKKFKSFEIISSFTLEQLNEIRKVMIHSVQDWKSLWMGYSCTLVKNEKGLKLSLLHFGVIHSAQLKFLNGIIEHW